MVAAGKREGLKRSKGRGWEKKEEKGRGWEEDRKI
jgi:hypothetical protein